MSYIRIWVHFVWATKNRDRILTKEFRPVLFNHILDNAKQKGIYIDQINGHLDHVHALVSLKSTQKIEEIAQQLKGESAHWTNNKFKKLQHKLSWQKEYFAVSVSESQLSIMRNYIKNQEEHHKRKSFQQEVEAFMKKYNFQRLQG